MDRVLSVLIQWKFKSSYMVLIMMQTLHFLVNLHTRLSCCAANVNIATNHSKTCSLPIHRFHHDHYSCKPNHLLIRIAQFALLAQTPTASLLLSIAEVPDPLMTSPKEALALGGFFLAFFLARNPALAYAEGFLGRGSLKRCNLRWDGSAGTVGYTRNEWCI